MIRLAACLAAAVALLLMACSGSKPQGADTPEKAALRLVQALAKEDNAEVRLATEPDRRKDRLDAEAFELDLPPGRKAKAPLTDPAARANLEEDKQYASVKVTGRIDDRAVSVIVLTVEQDGRWYATTPDNDYWRDVKKQEEEREAASSDPVTASFLAQLDEDPSLPGEYFKPHPGVDGVLCSSLACAATMDDRRHVGGSIPTCSEAQIAQGRLNDPLCYTSNPPTSGPHAGIAAPFGILRAPASKEMLVHSMEHGGVVIWYNTDNAALVRQIESIALAELARQRLVVVSQYTGMEPETIALTSWTRLLKFASSDFSAEKVQAFIIRHSKRFNPEGF